MSAAIQQRLARVNGIDRPHRLPRHKTLLSPRPMPGICGSLAPGGPSRYKRPGASTPKRGKAMRIAIAFGTALAVVLAAPEVWGAAHPTGKHAAAKPAAAKPAPSCAALAFRPLPSGASDGEQTAGMYRSR